MADITYHEKSGANPNEPAHEDTVIEVLRKAVDKRVSSESRNTRGILGLTSRQTVPSSRGIRRRPSLKETIPR
jgi:hypothetical protein